MLELQGVRGGYGRINILDGIALRVDDGEVLGVLGHNGMGKTTLMRAIVGEIAVTAGELRWQGESIARLPTHRRVARGIGYVPQGRRIFPLLSGGEQQILALARCLCTRPTLVLLDEPTEGIQPSIIEDMVLLLRSLRQRHRLSIVLVEQNLDFLRALSDRIVVLEKGRTVREARASDTAAMAALVESAEFAG